MKMPKLVWFLVIGMAVNVTGSSFIWPLNTIYMHNELGKSLAVAGIVLMINSFASVLGNLIGGNLFDKFGGYKSIMLGIIISLIADVGLVLMHGWPWYPVWLVLLGFGAGIVFPSIYAMAGTAWPQGGRKTFNAIYLAQNIGVALGASLGGFIAEIDFGLIFLVNLMFYVVFFFIAIFGYRTSQHGISSSNVMKDVHKIKDRTKFNALLTVCVTYCLCWIAYVQWQTTIATQTQGLDISLKQYSLLWSINGLFILLGQPLIAPIINKFQDKIKLQIAIGLIIFLSSFLITSFAETYSMFVVGMLILTIGEMFIWPAIPTIANNLAPKGRTGVYQGIVNSTATLGRAIGPLLGGVIVDVFSIQMMYYFMMIFIVLGFFTLVIYDRKLKVEN